MKPWELRRAAAAFFMPNRCPFCDELIGINEFWCERCYNRLPFLENYSEIPAGLDGFSAVCRYSAGARTAILRMKNGRYRYSIDAMAVLIAENAHGLIKQADFITAVPAGRKRRRQLGYAQSEETARLISMMTGKPFKRVFGVNPGKCEQKRLNAAQRRENAKNSFRLIKPDLAAGRNILIIDDVCTTGATLGELARQLKAAGAVFVSGAAFAKVIMKK